MPLAFDGGLGWSQRTAARAAGACPALAVEEEAARRACCAILVPACSARATGSIALDALCPLPKEAWRTRAQAHPLLLQGRARSDALGAVQEGKDCDMACQTLEECS